MPRKNSTAWSVGNWITAARLNAFNADIDDIYSTGSDRMKVYRLTTDPDFQVTIGAGNYRVGSAEWQYAGGNVTVGASTTTYIMLNSAGSIVTSTSGWNWQNAKLAIVVSNASAITSITIWRNDLVGGELGAAGFQNITSTTYTWRKLTAFTADGVNFTVNYERWVLKSISNWSNTWTVTRNGWKIISTSKT